MIFFFKNKTWELFFLCNAQPFFWRHKKVLRVVTLFCFWPKHSRELMGRCHDVVSGNAGQGPSDHILVRVCLPLVWSGKGAGPAQRERVAKNSFHVHPLCFFSPSSLFLFQLFYSLKTRTIILSVKHSTAVVWEGCPHASDDQSEHFFFRAVDSTYMKQLSSVSLKKSHTFTSPQGGRGNELSAGTWATAANKTATD